MATRVIVVLLAILIAVGVMWYMSGPRSFGEPPPIAGGGPPP